jgi:hypothetical protein
VNRPYGVDAGAGRNIAGLMARNVGATLAVARKGRKYEILRCAQNDRYGGMRAAPSRRALRILHQRGNNLAGDS